MKGISYLTITGEYGVILNVKPTTPEHDMEPYRAISLLPTMGKLLEKLKRMKKYIAIHCLVCDHPLVFREKHSTFDQIHRIVNSISKSFWESVVYSSVSSNSFKNFDKVNCYSNWSNSYHNLCYRNQTQQTDILQNQLRSTTTNYTWSTFEYDLHLWYISHTTITLFANYMAFLSCHGNATIVSENVQLGKITFKLRKLK